MKRALRPKDMRIVTVNGCPYPARVVSEKKNALNTLFMADKGRELVSILWTMCQVNIGLRIPPEDLRALTNLGILNNRGQILGSVRDILLASATDVDQIRFPIVPITSNPVQDRKLGL